MGSFQNRPVLLALLAFIISWVSANTVRFEVTLTWEDWAPDGISRKIILTNGQYPSPPLYLRQGDHVEFLVVNALPFATTIHFHGISQAGTPWSDGTPGVSQRPISPGSSFLYKWTAGDYGSYFYHAHARGQMEDGLYGAIYIRPDDSVKRPFGLITDNKDELEAMRHAEEKTTPVLLSDWRQLTSEEVWNGEEKSGFDALCVNALLINGKGSVNCLSRQTLDKYTTAAQKTVMGNDSLTDIGCLPPTSATVQGNYPHNFTAIPPTMFSGCTPSHGLTETLLVDPSASSYVSFDLISPAGLSVIAFSIDEHPMYVYAVDGRYIVPKLVDALAVSTGSRYSVMVKLDKPAGDYTIRLANYGLNQILANTAIMSYNTPVKKQQRPSVPSIDITGAPTTNNTVMLDDNTIVPFAIEVPGQDVDQTVLLNVERYNASYRWLLGNTSLPLDMGESYPLLYNPSEAKKGVTVRTRNGTWVDLIFKMNAIQPPHPIHKHSNKFFVIGQGNGDFSYSSVAEAMKFIPGSFNFKNPQLRDTFSTPPATQGPTWLAIRYQVVNPGAFLLHCHIQVHFSGGLALVLLDGVDKWPENIPEEYRLAVLES